MVADASKLPIEDATADMVVNIAMLEHVENPEAVVNEMSRIAKPGAHFIFHLPFIVPFHAARMIFIGGQDQE